MSRIKVSILFALAVIFAFFLSWNFKLQAQGGRARALTSAVSGSAPVAKEDADPDLPQKLPMGDIDKSEYLRLRGEYINRLRGLVPDQPFDATLRTEAVRKFEIQQQAMVKRAEAARATAPNSPDALLALSWTELGPRPVPNGQTQQYPATTAVTGRATAVVVDQTDSNKVYLGTAQGGVWRSLDGGATWKSIFDSAATLSIGALTLDPTDPTILFVGTGEASLSADGFPGVGIFRIRQVSTTPVVEGPFDTRVAGTGSAAAAAAFANTGINKIVIDPNDHNKMFIGNFLTFGGAGGTQAPNISGWGLWFCPNALAANPTFSRVSTIPTNSDVTDIVFEPGSSSNLLVATGDFFGLGAGGASTSGIYRSTNANTASQSPSTAPTFTKVLGMTYTITTKFAIQKNGANVTVYAATSETPTTASCVAAGENGQVRKSVDGGVTWLSTPAAVGTGGIILSADGYCGGQCNYDQPIAVNPLDPNVVYVGGNARGTCSDVMKHATDGLTFVRDDQGLHADAHSLFFDTKTTPATVWFANDGGIWKRPDAAPGTAWITRNLAPLGTIQFVSLAVHPKDQNFTIGGTQDNGD